MGQCLGKPKNVKTHDSYKLEKVSEKNTTEESVEEKRRKAAEAAEKRIEKQTNKGVIGNGGKLSKNIEKQKSVSKTEYHPENKALDPAIWN
ncbi:hypothetical protein BCR36DRAFT_586107 [Piromyces finnis]|uniref:Uncharacterized protein n=1 Tax=Piromyces finnis TaxID=1754191 RepID=A0A1Y1V0A2_9FUNG|nr:hypothetical protein BCR36DRAFT_586107 [Piromyces finnis]|eukprot:ORX44487.1 hypothetical protein BCR36DRAFT_586107 [Piromyces finnis]